MPRKNPDSCLFAAAHMLLHRFQDTIDMLPVLVFAKDSLGRFVFVNKPVADLYGKTVEAMVDESHSRLHSHQDEELAAMLKDDMEVISSKTIKVRCKEPCLASQERICFPMPHGCL